jgi:lysophospholipase L1-like esterase
VTEGPDRRSAMDHRGRRAVLLSAAWVLGVGGAIARVAPHGLRGAVIAGLVGAAGLDVLVFLDIHVGPRRLRARVLGAVALAALLVAGVHLGFLYQLAVATVGTTLSYGAFVRWPRPQGRPSRRAPVATLALAPLVVAMVQWSRHPSPIAFAVLATASAVTLGCYARYPAAIDRIRHGVDHIGLAVSRIITTTVATAVMVVIVVPINLLSRLMRYSPLDSGWSTPATAWVRIDPLRMRMPNGLPPTPESMAALELAPSRLVRRRSRRRVLAPAVAVVAVAIAVVTLPGIGPFRKAGPNLDVPAPGAGTFTRKFETDPAFKDAPWARNLRLDLLDAWQGLEFNAASGGWQIRDVSSAYINVKAGERKTIAPDRQHGAPLVVWFLGGSAAFGAGQRDAYTIPSDLVRRANADHIPLEVRNLAVPATVDWQSAMLLIERLKWDAKPDLVVFYDGANDLALQGVLASRGRGGSDQPASLLDGQVDAVLRERAAKRGRAEGLLPPSTPERAEPVPSPATQGDLVGARYAKGIDVVRSFCSTLSVPVSFFWQPDLRDKKTLTDVDQDTLRKANIDGASVKQFQKESSAARAHLAELQVTDLTDVFDGERRALYWDTVHTNETGASIVADAIYERLAPQLRRLRAGAG